MIRLILSATVILSFLSTAGAQNCQPLKLWYDRQADYFEESLPIGNGKMGALVYGSPDKECIFLNDITFWTGKPVDNEEGGEAYKWIPEIRKALFDEDYEKAEELQHHVQGHNSSFYQPLATMYITDYAKGDVSGYYRELNIDSAVATVRYARGGVMFEREYFASHPDKVIAIKLSADKPQAINCGLSLTSQVPHSVKASRGQITVMGHATGDGKNSIHFCSLLTARHKDGSIEVTDSTLQLTGVTEATLYFVNETSFNGFDRHPVTQGAPYIENVADDAWHIVNFTYSQLKARHIHDYRSMFGRLRLSLGEQTCRDSVPTDRQLREYTDNCGGNTYLETLYFQYGRYLLISCSRTPGVPANLQGLWTPHKWSPWRGNYTVNINLEENYWPAEAANLPETAMPLDDFIKALSETGRHTARHYYGVNNGWCSSHNSDIWAMSNPVGEHNESPMWANWNMGGAWLVNALWEHYAFSLDKRYLRETAYPLMKGAADFVMEWLVENPKHPGELITAPCTSPEAEYVTDKGVRGATFYGGTADMAIIRELLTNTLNAARALDTDGEYRQRLAGTIDRLRPYHIGKRGNIMEWYHDWDDHDRHHRHQSHLIGLYPGHQISPSATPELAEASAKTLDMKGDETTGWSTGWRINLWARLHDGNRAYGIFRKLLTYVSPDGYEGTDKRHSGGTYPNLFDAHPPFQIDGNFGGTAGVCEMLAQSDGNSIELLPALPDAWRTGSISGLRARGGIEISMSWKDGKVTEARMKSNKGGCMAVRYNGKEKTVRLKAGEVWRITE